MSINAIKRFDLIMLFISTIYMLMCLELEFDLLYSTIWEGVKVINQAIVATHHWPLRYQNFILSMKKVAGTYRGH